MNIPNRDLLITQDLISAVSWLEGCPPSWKDKAYKDLHNKLARVWETIQDPAVVRGINFEKSVYGLLHLPTEQAFVEAFKEYSHPKIAQFYTRGKGGILQKKIKTIERIDGQSYCLYGKTDIYFKDLIIDYKTTKEYKGPSKYLNSIQHVLYCYITKIPKFVYLIAEFNDDTIFDVHEVQYTMPSVEIAREEVYRAVRRTMSFIESDPDLLDLYLTKYCLY